MSKKISLVINRTSFTIDLDDEFAEFLSKRVQNDSLSDDNSDTKVLLNAYLKCSKELFDAQDRAQKLLKSLED